MKSLKDFIKSQEGEQSSVYTDTTGNPTIGAGANLNSPDIPKILEEQNIKKSDLLQGRKLSSQEADRIMDAQIEEKRKYYENIKKKDFPKANLNDEEQTALMSMMYNNPKLLGPNMRSLLNQNDKAGVAKEIMLRSNKGGVPGIQLRRMEEAQQFLGPAELDNVINSLSYQDLQMLRSRIRAIDNAEHREKAIKRFNSLFKKK